MSDFVVSARKYRPKTFNQVVGQQSITTTLKRAIKDNHLAQSFLFCGPRGVGKTSCARIFAKEINQFNHDSELDDFSFNIFELDAASNNSVEDIRNLTDQVRIPPQAGKYKVYIIDEVHMLSQSAFNAFLKTLEEPPKHAKFILATTEKHKIIPTILSRCQIFDFKRVSVQDISAHLSFVCEKEGVVAEKQALDVIAQKADGALRDALSIFDRLVSYSSKNLSYKDVITHLNILDESYYFRTVDYVLKNEISSLLLLFNDVLNNGFDPNHFMNGLSSHLRDLLVCKSEDTIRLLDRSEVILSQYREQANFTDTSFLVEALKLCNNCDVQYRQSSNQSLRVELTLMQLCSILNQTIEKKKHEDVVTVRIPGSNEKKQREEYKQDIHISGEGNQKVDNISQMNLSEYKKKDSNTFSILGALDEMSKEEHVEELQRDVMRNNPFTKKDMLDSFLKLTEVVESEGKINLAIALGSFDPILLKDNIIELSLSNTSQQELVEDQKYMILQFLRDSLKNDTVELKSKVSSVIKDNVPYTNKDKYKKILTEYPDVKKLGDQLGLDPEY